MKINFHRFNIRDDVDAEIYAAEPILAWQKTPHGAWVMAHAHNITWYRQPDAQNWGTDILIRGELHDPQLITEYFLRWPNSQ